MNDLFKEITSFGKNCFTIQIGRGPKAVKAIAFVSIALLGGDNEHLNYVCGTSSMCIGRNCRRCLSSRTYRFVMETDENQTRVDNDHEVLAKRRKEMRSRQLLTVANRRNYVKTDAERDLLALAENLRITKIGDNPLYSRFWYANYRGLLGMHASCPPDWLHTILKGCVEKTVAAILLLVEYFGKFDVSGLFTGRLRRLRPKRHLPWKSGKSILDHRIRHFPIHLFHKRFGRYTICSFTLHYRII
jgi:hypothetical protein